jgi:hypothetical protein
LWPAQKLSRPILIPISFLWPSIQDPGAARALNRALLLRDFGVDMEFPLQHLVPTVRPACSAARTVAFYLSPTEAHPRKPSPSSPPSPTRISLPRSPPA